VNSFKCVCQTHFTDLQQIISKYSCFSQSKIIPLHHQFLNSTVMAKESITNYSVSKKTSMMLDAIKLLDQAWELVDNSLRVKNETDDDEKIHRYMEKFDEGFDIAKEFVIAQIEENLRDQISITNFNQI